HAPEIPWLKEAALVAKAADSYGTLLRSLAKEARRRYEGGEVVYAAELAELLDRDPHALFARATTERRAYEELMSRKQYAAASRLTLAPDRSGAFLALAKEASGVERKTLLILALRENAMLPAVLVRELAKDLEGEEKTFVQNRINYIEGNPREKGPQRMPQLAVPDLTKLLAAGDADGAREALELARRAGGRSYEAAEDQAKAYADQAEDKVQAAEMLFAAASKHSLAAALRVKAHGSHDDLKRIAPLLCILSLSQWRALCDHEDPDVRDAAAGAAAAHGTTAHLPALAELCADGSEQVRLSAITSFVRIKPEAERIYADYQKLPTKSQLAELHRLAAE
ncbi:MAG: HEAT repeat domain-containing protein, partial [Planctomycetota bacterium]|nr:HEAT repeat domain-containing protein [Planctomycetota bacterium]